MNHPALQIFLAYYYKNLYIWVAVEFLFGIIGCIILNWKINKEYSWLKVNKKAGKALLKKYPEIIESVIREAELFLLLASNNICKSNWIDKEVERAINYSRKLIIFKIDDCSYNDVFNFLLACVQCSEVIKDISLNDPAFARAYNDLKTLFDSDVPSKQIHIAKNDETSIKESGLSKEEQIREANNMVKAFMTSKEEVISRTFHERI